MSSNILRFNKKIIKSQSKKLVYGMIEVTLKEVFI